MPAQPGHYSVHRTMKREMEVRSSPFVKSLNHNYESIYKSTLQLLAVVYGWVESVRIGRICIARAVCNLLIISYIGLPYTQACVMVTSVLLLVTSTAAGVDLCILVICSLEPF